MNSFGIYVLDFLLEPSGLAYLAPCVESLYLLTDRSSGIFHLLIDEFVESYSRSLGKDLHRLDMWMASNFIFHAEKSPDVCWYVWNLTAGVWFVELDIPEPCLPSFDFLD